MAEQRDFMWPQDLDMTLKNDLAEAMTANMDGFPFDTVVTESGAVEVSEKDIAHGSDLSRMTGDERAGDPFDELHYDSRVAIFQKKTSSAAVEFSRKMALCKAGEYVQSRRVRMGTKRMMEEEVSGKDESDSDLLRQKKYARRLELNRESAGVSRVRRRAYIEELEQQLEKMEAERDDNARMLDVARAENLVLRVKLERVYYGDKTNVMADFGENLSFNFNEYVAHNTSAA
eukprot:CAMPEP_0184678048 /NCGR_PEP_ID=MMETSP0312-20130426/672_1 /TAXON_ID=31354 /ORGANISM="Compsopogon coeruleus, Strain SAG 36.94" /LENGTH=230 /DNA_ID=CAMNT_0027126375 /DNA_START=197 /DNA_END=889 /DNA_ORIENTATION=-